jgi:hypothetical protein
MCRCGLVIEGDEVLRVGGKRVKSLSVREVTELMRAGDVGSKVLRPLPPRRFLSPSSSVYISFLRVTWIDALEHVLPTSRN